MVDKVSTVVIPRPTRSLVASRCIQNDTQESTTIKMHGTYTFQIDFLSSDVNGNEKYFNKSMAQW